MLTWHSKDKVFWSVMMKVEMKLQLAVVGGNLFEKKDWTLATSIAV